MYVWQGFEYISGLFIPRTTRSILIAFRAAALTLISFIFSSSKIIPRTDTTTRHISKQYHLNVDKQSRREKCAFSGPDLENCFRPSFLLFTLHLPSPRYLFLLLPFFLLPNTAWKMVCIWSFSGTIFPAFGVKTEIYSLNLRIQSECRKIRTRRTLNMSTFYIEHSFSLWRVRIVILRSYYWI